MRTKDYLDNYQSNTSWSIEPIIGQGHNVLLYGVNGSGKSLTAWEIAKAVAKGEKLFGKFQAKKGCVLIIDEETPEADFHERVRKIFGDEDLDIDVWPRPHEIGFCFDDPKWIGKLKQKMGYNPQGNHDPKYDVIIFDNLNAMQGDLGFEESNVAVGKLRNIFTGLRAINSDLVIILIHHEGKDPKKGARGVSALLDMSDTVIKVQRVWDKPFRFAVRQIPRKRPVSVKSFIVEVKDDGNHMCLEYIGEEEFAELPDDNDLDVFEYLVANQAGQQVNILKTVDAIKNDLKGKLGEQAIRESLRKLARSHQAINEEHGVSNLGKYSLNTNMPDSHFNRALKGEIQKRGY